MSTGFCKNKKRQNMIGNTFGFKKGRTAWNKGMTGEHSTNWKGGIKKPMSVYNKEWRERNKDKWNAINRLYRHKRRALGYINTREWLNKVSLLGNKCQICFKTEPEIKITIDHIIPVSKGGTNHIDNLQPLCLLCNLSKYNKI